MHLVARLDIFATREPNIVARLPAIYSTRDRAIRPAGRPRRARLTFVQLLSQLEGLLIRRAAVVNFVKVQRRVGERLFLEGAGTSLHQNRRRTAGGVELRAQREAEHCKMRQTFVAIPWILCTRPARLRRREFWNARRTLGMLRCAWGTSRVSKFSAVPCLRYTRLFSNENL